MNTSDGSRASDGGIGMAIAGASDVERARKRAQQNWRHVREKWLSAAMNARIYGYRAEACIRKETRLKIFIAIASSGTVAGLTLWRAQPVLWQILSGMNAVAAVSLQIFNYTAKIQTASELRVQYQSLAWRYKNLLSDIEWDPNTRVDKTIQKLEEKEAEMWRTESKTFSRDRVLVRKCQREVEEAEGMRSMDKGKPLGAHRSRLLGRFTSGRHRIVACSHRGRIRHPRWLPNDKQTHQKPHVQTTYKTAFFDAIPEIVAFASSTSYSR